MSLPTVPPRYSSLHAALAPVRYQERGWRVYAVERGIGFRRADPKLLGVFNTALRRSVRRYQSGHDLDDDGIVGPATWMAIGTEAARRADKLAGIDQGTSLGFWEFEGGNTGAATNWDQPGGVDCGAGGLRVYGPPFASEDHLFGQGYGMLEAFNPRAGLLAAAHRFAHECEEILEERPGFERGNRHKRIAALAHNAPFLAAQIRAAHPPKGAEFPRDYSKTPDAKASWTQDPSTGRPYTHEGWAIEYPARLLSFTL